MNNLNSRQRDIAAAAINFVRRHPLRHRFDQHFRHFSEDRNAENIETTKPPVTEAELDELFCLLDRSVT